VGSAPAGDDLLRGADRPATTTSPNGSQAVVRADPGNYHVFGLEGDALVHLTVPVAEDLGAVLAAVQVPP
jgi:hypothetical protein